MSWAMSCGFPCAGVQAKVAASDVAGARRVYDEMVAGGGSAAAQAEALASLATAVGLQGGSGMEVSALPRLF